MTGEGPLRPTMRKILISACLLGERVRYDGGTRPLQSALLERWLAEGRVVPFCPEVAGGLPVPRPPVERQPDGRVLDVDGVDRTRELDAGARQALEAAKREGVVVAVLKANSPSCGSTRIYDGTFSGRLIDGAGVTAQLFRREGIAVFDETRLAEAEALLAR